MNSSNRTSASIKILQIIWIALMITLGVYVLIAELVAPELYVGQPVPDYIPVLRLAFGFASVVMLFGAVFIKRIILRKNQNANSTFQTYQTGVIISLAITENVAIMGLALRLLGDPSDIFYLFILTAAFFMFLHRPQEHQLTDYPG